MLGRILDAPSRQVTIAGLAIAAAIIISFLHAEWGSYQRTLARAERDTRNVAHLLAEQAAGLFDGIDETLRAVGRLRADVVRGIYRSQASIYVHLQTLQGGSPALVELGWFDSYGDRVASSESLDPAVTSIADQEFFSLHRTEASRAIHVSAPTRPPGSEDWRIIVSKRIENLDGSFAGVATGKLAPEEFVHVYRSLELGPGYRLTLLRRDGTVMASATDQLDSVGRSRRGSDLIQHHLPLSSDGTYRDPGTIDGESRIASYRSVPRAGSQLVVEVSVSRRQAFAEFLNDFAADAVKTSLELIVLLVGTRLLVFGLRRRERLQAQLAATSAAAQAARSEAENANRAKSDFLANMSHELRTPLNAVIGFGQMLELDFSRTLTDRQKEYSRDIVTSGKHLLNLVNEVLDLSGVEAGRLALKLDRVAVAEALAGVGEIMKPVAATAGISLDLSDAAGIPDIHADELRLRQVLINLVANAIKYNVAGGTVTVTAFQRTERQLRFVVTDTGRGMKLERQAEVFEPFRRLGVEFTGIEGTGLGLALAKRLVEAMGGAIGFDSEPGRGSTFWVDFPIEEHKAAPSSAKVIAAVSPVPRGGFSVLYLEDNLAYLRLVQHLMATLPDVTLHTAQTGEAALAIAASNAPDLILVDLDLLGTNAYDIVARLKAIPTTRNTAILAVGAAPLLPTIGRGAAAGIARYLPKPFDFKTLLGAIDAAFAEQASRRSAGGQRPASRVSESDWGSQTGT